jgi:hypothetical protein
MHRRMNPFAAFFALFALACASAAAQERQAALDDAVNRINAGLANSGTRKVWVGETGQTIDTRRFRLVGADGCTLLIRMENVSDPFGRNRRKLATAFLYTIPLSELDAGRIRVDGRGPTAGPVRMYVTDLNLSEGSSGKRRMAVVSLPSVAGRKAIGYASAVASPFEKGVSHFDGRQASFGIEFKEAEAAEPVAAAFRQASQICGAKQ